jgi:uncharacterized radical SAM superfamily Fe-S cluster-containing enzyme
MTAVNNALCVKCRRPVPSEHVIRGNQVYLVRECPDCGPSEALLSGEAAEWQRKRHICQFDAEQPVRCNLDCERCGKDHKPKMVFLDVTNRCNMNCPICINNTPSMGFVFDPPFSYFEKVLTALGDMDPKPVVQLFGGEPTVRKDLFDIIEFGRSKGLDLRIVTNGLRLADEDYCRRICESKVHVLLALDGLDPTIYDRLRKNPGALEKKLKALENLKKHSRHKNTIMCCVARHVNDRHMRGLIDFCHENRSFIKCLHLIPLTENWSEGEFETDLATTTEDVERIIDEAFDDGTVEFLPMGPSENLRRSLSFFGTAPMKFGGVHPNCETAAYLLTDGTRYWPLSRFLKRPLKDVAEEVVVRAKKIEPKLAGLDPARALQRWRGRLLVLRTFGPLVLRSLDLRALFGGSPLAALFRIGWGLVRGKRLKNLLRQNAVVQGAMMMVVLPFEEYHSVEAARLQDCPSGFAFEDPATGQVRTLPVCVWSHYKADIQRGIMEKYEAEAVPAR